MKRVRWADQALKDLNRIIDHYAPVAPHFPLMLLERIEQLLVRLLRHPFSAPPIGDLPYRKARVGGTDFLLFYVPTDKGIEVARIYHARQDWRPL